MMFSNRLAAFTMLSATLLTTTGCFGRRSLAVPSDGGGADGSLAAAVGVPCEVAAILRANCWACHAGAYAPPLVTYAELAAPSAVDSTQTVLQRCIARMNDTASPMPPAPRARVSTVDIAVIDAWATAGAPMSTCTEDAGAPPPGDAGPDPYGTPTVCSSGTNWLLGTHRSQNMEPGLACIACHARSRGAPRFDIAGTVYATAHEPDSCNGTNAGAVVVITDATGGVWRLSTNSVGNFSALGTGMTMPYLARVEYAGRTREMVTPQSSGDCNTCHTLAGTTTLAGAPPAPGRIMLP